MSAPNQRIIYIERISDTKQKDFFKIGNKQLNKAASDLNGNAFKLYIYLADNKDNYILELSSKHFVQWSGTSDSTYDRAFKELKDKGYLEQSPEKKNVYRFKEESESYFKRHKDDIILISSYDDISKLFPIKESK